uniref:F-box associated domain-containing protein n=1 Tax=Aegilops tauschii TaxID=37682 RepID=N1R0P6_AEGTA
MALVVWDPMTGCRREMNLPDVVYNNYGAAVLCAATGCDHRACHAAPFQVVFVGLNLTEEGECVAHAWLSLPETSDWSKPCLGLHLAADAFIEPMPPVLVKEALHFMLEYDDDDSVAILKYDLSSNSLSLIDAPIMGSDVAGATMLMAMTDGSLGYALVVGLMLYLWSRQMDSSRVAPWGPCTNINLGKLLPIQNHKKRLRLVGSGEASDIVFVTTDLGIYEINVKSQQWKSLWKREKFCALIPFMSFYNPQERAILSQTAHSQGMVK